MEGMVEIYLASMWKYKDASISHILAFLRSKHPDSHYTYDSDEGWFRVNCSAAHVHAVQAAFRDVHADLEHKAVDADGNFQDNAWLQEPSPGELVCEMNAAPAKGPVVDHLCPVVFDRFVCSKVWARIKNETPDCIAVQSFLSDEDRRAVMKQSGAHIELDPAGRLVFLGSPDQGSLARAAAMLDNLFRKFTFELPPPKHMMWSESEGSYTVDARFMAHVNDGMLTSTIFDPGLYPGTRLADVFKAVFSKAACLRICFYDRVKRIEVSYFGPCSEPIFHDQARKWPVWFKHAEYTPKTKGVAAPPAERKDKVTEPHAGDATVTGGHKNSERLDYLSREIDLLTDDISSFGNASCLAVQPPPAPLTPLQTGKPASIAAPSPAPSPSNALVPFIDLDADKHGYQLKLLQQFLGDPFKKGSTVSHKEAHGTTDKREASKEPSKEIASAKEEPLISFDDDDAVGDALAVVPAAKANRAAMDAASDDNLLIDIPVDVPPERQISPRAALVAYKPPTSSNALVRRTTFANSLCTCIGRLMGDLPYSRGRVRMQVDLGRLYLMDTIPEGLASNLPGEPACGWPHTDIMGRLDTVCISPDSVVFSKALTLFANDIESVLGMPGTAGAQAGALTVFGGSAPPIVDIETDTAPAWTFHDKRIVYELKCERRVVHNAAGVLKVQSPFVVEIDGTMPGAFRYSLRRVDDNRPPIWVHCIQRSWDARVVVSYSQTDELEAEYGAFARELLQTMVVPPGPMTNPRFQVAYDYRAKQHGGQSVYTKVQSARVRNVGRFISGDGASYLDVSWNRHMRMEMKADTGTGTGTGTDTGVSSGSKETGTLRFTGAEDDQARGMFGSWYEASVLSVAAEQGFRENETLAVGGMATWGRSMVDMDNMYEAAFGPALRLVQKMDGVGVLIDNGQGDGKQPVPPMKTRQTVGVKNFW